MADGVGLLSRWSWIGLGCLAVAIGGCSRPTAPPKHLVLVVVDTLRADVLGCYGGEAATPNIDRLAAEGVRFDQARSHIPITGPSHTSLFTSLLPHQHGVRNNTDVVPEDLDLLAEILGRNGFQTTGVVSLGVLGSRFGFGRGFDRFEDSIPRRFWRDAAEVNEVVLPLIHTRPEERHFLWIHYSDPHVPMSSPDSELPVADCFFGDDLVLRKRLDGRSFSIPIDLPAGETAFEVRPSEGDRRRRVILRRLRFNGGQSAIEIRADRAEQRERSSPNVFYGRTPMGVTLINPSTETVKGELRGTLEFTPGVEERRPLYLQEVEFVDRHIGRLVESLRSAGIWDNSLVVFVADHGEGLGENGRFAHADHLYDVTLRAPLILVAPGMLRPGTIVSTSVGLIDVMPTVLEVLGVEPPPEMVGETLLPLLERGGPDRAVVAMTFPPQATRDRRALISNGFKYIWTVDSEARELFDLDRDPGEVENLADRNPALADSMHEELLQALADRRADAPAEAAELTREEVEGLEALGYVQ